MDDRPGSQAEVERAVGSPGDVQATGGSTMVCFTAATAVADAAVVPGKDQTIHDHGGLLGLRRTDLCGSLVDSCRVALGRDQQKSVGTWFSANVTRRGSPTWDFYAPYPPDARDLAAPSSMGGTIISSRAELQSCS